MGEDKPIDISLKVTDNKVTFTVSKLKQKVAENEDVTLIWSLANGSGTSWWKNPEGIVFAPGWPGPAPSFAENKYSVSYKNTTSMRGSFKYTINVQLTGGSSFTEKLSFDPEVQNDPPGGEPRDD